MRDITKITFITGASSGLGENRATELIQKNYLLEQAFLSYALSIHHFDDNGKLFFDLEGKYA